MRRPRWRQLGIEAAPGASRPSLAPGPSALLRPLLPTALAGSGQQRAPGEGGAVGEARGPLPPRPAGGMGRPGGRPHPAHRRVSLDRQGAATAGTSGGLRAAGFRGVMLRARWGCTRLGGPREAGVRSG